MPAQPCYKRTPCPTLQNIDHDREEQPLPRWRVIYVIFILMTMVVFMHEYVCSLYRWKFILDAQKRVGKLLQTLEYFCSAFHGYRRRVLTCLLFLSQLFTLRLILQWSPILHWMWLFPIKNHICNHIVCRYTGISQLDSTNKYMNLKKYVFLERFMDMLRTFTFGLLIILVVVSLLYQMHTKYEISVLFEYIY